MPITDNRPDPDGGGGGGGAVDSVNGLTGVVVLNKSHISLGNVDNTSDANKPVSTAQQTALNLKADISSLATVATSNDYNDLDNLPTIPVLPTGNNNVLSYFDGTGTLVDLENWSVNPDGGIESNTDIEPNGLVAGKIFNGTTLRFKPLQDSPDEAWNLNNYNYLVDPDSVAFEMGTNGQFANLFNIGLTHEGNSDIGYINQ